MNSNRYLNKMEGSLDDKLRILDYIPHSADRVLDVGCADGALTVALAQKAPQTHFIGIDIDPVFISKATARTRNDTGGSVGFSHMYLRDLLKFDSKFDAIIFASVLHEFYSYGEGITSIIKALADAKELLKPGGKIIIRDMFSGTAVNLGALDRMVGKVYDKVWSVQDMGRLEEFEEKYGRLSHSPVSLNHYMLKRMYWDNWDHEMQEDYFPMTVWEYHKLMDIMGLSAVVEDSYLLPYINSYFRSYYKFNADELAVLQSTGLLVYEAV